MKTSNKRFLLIAGLLIFTLLILLFIRMIFNKPHVNPIGTVGNTAGNLYNKGLFCELDGIVYFSNSNDNGTLYSMGTDESHITKLNNSIAVNILADAKNLYYFQTGSAGGGNFENILISRGLMRTDHLGTATTLLTRDIIVTGQLVNNFLYLLTTDNKEISFYKTPINEYKKTELANYTINPACVYDGHIYYSGTLDDHHLYSLNTESDVPEKILGVSLWYPILYDNMLYFMDVEHNYRLCRYSFTDQSIQVLTEDRIDCYNIGGGTIYYQKNSTTTPQLKCMRVDGTDCRVVAEGNYTQINMTSQYVYFKEFGVDNITYHCPVGSVSYSVF